METRTARTPGPSGARPGEHPGGGTRGFFDDEPTLSTVKVPSDPAQVVVSHASFRVQLASPPTAAPGPGTRAPVIGGSARAPERAPGRTAEGPEQTPPAAAAGKRRAPVVWSGRSAPDAVGGGPADLLRAVRPDRAQDGGKGEAGATTQVLPRVVEGPPPSTGTVVGPRGPDAAENTRPQPLLSGMRPARGAFDEPEYADKPEYADEDGNARTRAVSAASGDPGRRQAYYPMRRMNLGVVLLPLRIFLGFISIYAGMSKLCDPVYFDGGERGSMVTWLRSLEPWTIASPLRDFALGHPVGAGLTVAFLQVIVGVLTMCGLWQRLAAGVGALLSVALLMTVSWSTVPAYDAPDFIYLAAWSPLILAGAPVYSVDAHLAVDAWKKLGPRVALWDLRERVLRRGALITSVVVGLTLLIGSLLGGAVRESQTATVPEPGKPPTNQQPGRPLPGTADGQPHRTSPGHGVASVPGTQGRTQHRRPAGPSASASSGAGQQRETSGPSSTPDQGQRQTVQAPRRTAPPQRTTAPRESAPQSPSSSGTSSSGSSSSGSSSSGTDSGTGSGTSSPDSSNGGGLGGLLGGG